MGKFDLNADDTDGSKISDVSEIVIHPDWKINSERYDADLSIVVLKDKMTSNDYIQPICLSSSKHYVTETGLAVFWRTSDIRKKEMQTEFEIPSVNASHCYTRYHELAFESSPNIFCGGYEEQIKTAPCLEDAGGGFYVLASDESWTIRGMVTGSLTAADTSCKINNFTLYTNVGKYYSWIQQTIMEKQTMK